MTRSTLLAALVSAAIPMTALAQTADELKNDDKTPGDVLTYGMGYSQHRFSPLTQINRQTVKRLVPAWSYSMADNRGLEGQALVKDGVVFLTDHEKTVAVDALTGREIWKTMVEYPPETTRVVCCGIVNRGAALFDGKLFRTTLDANVIALDAKTGKEVWRTKSSDPKDGYSMTVAPLVANGVVIAGVAGAEYGIRGYLEGFDAQTGAGGGEEDGGGGEGGVGHDVRRPVQNGDSRLLSCWRQSSKSAVRLECAIAISIASWRAPKSRARAPTASPPARIRWWWAGHSP